MNDDGATDITSLKELPQGWAQCCVHEAGAVQLGRQRSPDKRSNKYPTPYIRAANITWEGLKLDDVLEMEFTPKEREVFQLRDGDILLSEASGSADEVGKPALWRGEIAMCCFQNTVIRFRSRAMVPRFALHLFSAYAQLGVFAGASRGVGILHIGAERFSSLGVPLPPIPEQSRIADRIDELLTDLAAGVAALERVKRKLERYRAALLHAAVTGRLTAAWRAQRSPADEPGSALLQRILTERRRHWEQRTLANYEKAGKTPPKGWCDRYPEPVAPGLLGHGGALPSLPSEWCWATHDQIGDVQLGRQRSPEHHNGPHMRPYLRVANVYEDRIDTSDVLRMNFTPAEFETYALRRGDILLNEGQSMELVGRPALYRDELPGGCFQNTLVRQRPFIDVMAEYAFLVCRAQFRAGRFRKIASITTSIAHLGAQRFAALEFPLPPLSEQAAIVEAVNEKLSLIDNLEIEIKRGLVRAGRMRQSILKTAFAGRLVPQDPSDEPAAVLLERLQAEREATPTAGSSQSPRRPGKRPRQAAYDGDGAGLFEDDPPSAVRKLRKRVSR